MDSVISPEVTSHRMTVPSLPRRPGSAVRRKRYPTHRARMPDQRQQFLSGRSIPYDYNSIKAGEASSLRQASKPGRRSLPNVSVMSAQAGRLPHPTPSPSHLHLRMPGNGHPASMPSSIQSQCGPPGHLVADHLPDPRSRSGYFDWPRQWFFHRAR